MFIRPHLDYGDIVYDQAFNESFHKNIESIQYNTVIAIIGGMRVTSSVKPFQELRIEFLKTRRWLRNYVCFIKFVMKIFPRISFS